MNAFEFITPRSLFLEIGQSSLKILAGEDGSELALERQPNGRLTIKTREQVSAALRETIQKKSWLARPRALCAIGARGVSLRRLTLPPTTKENFQQLLALQIEKEFPLPPDEMAWGSYSLNGEPLPHNGNRESQDVLVAAVKKEAVEEYADLLSNCGATPVFTLGVLCSGSICSKKSRAVGLLDIGRTYSELVVFEDGIPVAVRSLSWGGEDVTRVVAQALQIPRDEAERLKIQLDAEAASNPERAQKAREAVRAAADSLAALVKTCWQGTQLWLTGRSAQLAEIGLGLSHSLGVACETLDVPGGEGQSAAIQTLRKWSEKNGQVPNLVLQVRRAKRGAERVEQPALIKWSVLASLLLVFALLLRYAEPFVNKPGLAKRVTEVKALKAKLPEIDQELGFLQHLDTNQPPYLSALGAIADAGRGTRIDSLTLNRRGDLVLRGSMPSSQQATDFRAALIKSGLFSSVVIDEQTPNQDRKVAVRITGKWKTAKEIKANPPQSNATSGSSPSKVTAATNPGSVSPPLQTRNAGTNPVPTTEKP